MPPALVAAWLDATPACIMMLTLRASDAAAAAAAASRPSPSASAAVAPSDSSDSDADAPSVSPDEDLSCATWTPTFVNQSARAWLGLAPSDPPAALLQRLHRADRSVRPLDARHERASTNDQQQQQQPDTWSMRVRMRMTDGTFALVQLQANRAPSDPPAAAPAAADASSYLCSLELVHSLSSSFLAPAALSALVSGASSPLSTCSAPAAARVLPPAPTRVMLPDGSGTPSQRFLSTSHSVYRPPAPQLQQTDSDASGSGSAPPAVEPFRMSSDSSSAASSSDGGSVGGRDGNSHTPSVPAPSTSFLSSSVSISVPPTMSLPSVVLPPESSRALAEDMWDSLPVMLCIILGGRFVRVSPLFEHVLGWSESELRAMHVRDIFHPEDVANIGVEAVRLNGGAYEPHDRPSTQEDPMSDMVVINRLREKRTGQYIQCMFRSSLSRQHFAVPPPLHSALSPPGIFSPQVIAHTPVDITPSPSPDDAISAAAAASAAASELTQGLAGASRRPSGSTSSQNGATSPGASAASAAASLPALEPFIHCMIRPMHAQERAALSSALDGIAHQKQEFISNITHELQTPMNGISASAELLAGTELTAEQTDLLSCIQVSAEHMQTIVGDILSFAMVDKGGVTLEHKALHLNAVVEDSIVLCFRPRQHDHLEILHSIATDLPAQVMGDVARVRQVLVHLLMNALKFTKQGTIVIRVRKYDGSNSPAALIQAQTARLQQLQDDLQAGVLTDEEAVDAEAQLAAPQMVVIQPPHQLPSLFAPPPVTESEADEARSPSPFPSPPLESSGALEDPSASPRAASASISASAAGSTDDRTPFLLEFAISDSGVGIDARHSSRLFQIFSQGDSSSSKEHQGTGIGLLTSLKLVRQMGGDVWVSSIAGMGSTFFFTIKCTAAVPVSHPTPLHAHSTLDQTAAAPAVPQHVSTHTTPLARVRNLVEQEQGRHTRKSSVSDSSGAGSLTSTATGTGSLMGGFDSPSSTSSCSPHRSPLIAPRFLPSFHTVGVVAANTTALDVIATDLRGRGATVCTFTSCTAALQHTQQNGTVDCWIIDSLTGTQMRRRGSAAHHSGLMSLSDEPIYASSAGELTGVELVARLLEQREQRERQRHVTAMRAATASSLHSEAELRVVLLVQSFGLPTSLPLPDSVMNSAHIRLIQVHKPFKHQVLYDAIRTLGDQLSLPLSGSGSERGSGYAMSLMQTKSRRTLGQAGGAGGPSGSGSGDTMSSWATRRVMLGPRSAWSHVPRNSMDMGPATPLPTSDTPPAGHATITVHTHLQHTVPVNQAASPTGQSPLLPPSPFAHSLIFPTAHQARLHSASASDSSISPSITTHLSYPISGPATAPVVGTGGGGGGAPSLPLPRSSSVKKKSSNRSKASHANPPHHGSSSSAAHRAAMAGVLSHGAASGASSLVHVGSHSPHITTGTARPRSSTTLCASFAKRYPLRILVVEDNLVNMKVCVRILSKLGFQPDQAVDGQEAQSRILALARSEGRTYDVVLLDLQMPVMDGFECAEIVLREFGCCNLPVTHKQCVHHAKLDKDAWCAALPAAVAYHQMGATNQPDRVGAAAPGCPRPILMALTANTTEEDRARSFKVAMDEFISKPISINDIVVPLKKWAKLLANAGGFSASHGSNGGFHAHSTHASAPLSHPIKPPSGTHLSPHRHSNLLLGRRASDSGLLSPPAEVNSENETEMPSPGLAAMGRPALSALKSLDALRCLDLGGVVSSSCSSNEHSPRPLALKHSSALDGSTTTTSTYSFNTSAAPEPMAAWSLPHSSALSVPSSASSVGATVTAPPAPSSAPGPTPSPPPSSSSLMPPMSPRHCAMQLPVHRITPSTSGSGSASTRLVSRHLPPSSRVSSAQKSPLLQSRVILNVVREPSAGGVGFVTQPASTSSGHGSVPLQGPTATRVTVSPVHPKAPGERAPSRSPLSPTARTLAAASSKSFSSSPVSSTNSSPADRVRRTVGLGPGVASSSASPTPDTLEVPQQEARSSRSSSPADQPYAHAQAFLLGLVHNHSK